MELYIIRHGIAVDIGEEGVERDEDRMLSSMGRKKTKSIAKAIKILGCEIGKIYTSPLVRARETAAILGKALELEVATHEALKPAVGAEHVIAWLGMLKGNSAAVVGHMPDLGDLASRLLSEEGGCEMTFKKGAVCCIRFDQHIKAGAGRLEWLLQPKHAFRIVGKS